MTYTAMLSDYTTSVHFDDLPPEVVEQVGVLDQTRAGEIVELVRMLEDAPNLDRLAALVSNF